MKKKTAIITARLTPAEKAAIERRAQQANMTVTDYIVKCTLGKNVRQTDELVPILSELKAQGRNLNQLTKLANMGRIDLVDAEKFHRGLHESLRTHRRNLLGGGVTVATFIAIRNVKQTRGAMAGAMGYVSKDEKTLWKGISLVAGHNCVPQSSYIEFLTTKKRFHKTDGRQFYHFVQSFAEGDRLSPQLANAIGVELAEQEFPDFEVLVATHIDTGHLHNHLIVNSVSCVDGRKLHQNTADLQHHRDVNDQICMKYHLSVLSKTAEA